MDGDVLVLDINTDTFKNLKNDFNEKLKALLDKMVSRNLEEGDIAIAVHLKFTGEEPGRLKYPSFQHEVKFNFKETEKKTGTLAPANTEVVYDSKFDAYVFRRIDDGQQDIFAEVVDVEVVEDAASVQDDVLALPEAEMRPDEVPALPECISDTDASTPCQTCCHYKGGDPCGIACDDEFSGYVAAPNDEAVHSCSSCVHSRQNGQPKKTGPCETCNNSDQWSGRCENCKFFCKRPPVGRCNGCDRKYGKWEPKDA